MQDQELFNFFKKYHLSTEGYYFIYRPDKYDREIVRATLYKTGTNDVVSDTWVTNKYGLPNRTHFNIINLFEAEVQLTQKK